MIRIAKYILIGLISGILLSAAGYFYWKSIQPKPSNFLQTIIQTNNLVIDSLENQNKRILSDFNASKDKIDIYRQRANKNALNAKQMALYADSLENILKQNNDSVCFDALRAKNEVIILRDSVIINQALQIEQDSLNILRFQSVTLNDSIIISKQGKLIDRINKSFTQKCWLKRAAFRFGLVK